MNYKTTVTDTVKSLTRDQAGFSVKQNEIRRLGIGYVLATEAEKLKKSAKKNLTKLGLLPSSFAEDTEVALYEDNEFLLMSKTSCAARRLNEDALRAALDAEKLSAPAKARIMDAAFAEAKPATSFKVEQK